jgi:ribosome-binding protein aMBF1 (putative translation factor)
MTPDRFRDIVTKLEGEPMLLSYTSLARMLEYDARLVRRWAAGKEAVPNDVGEWLEKLAAFLEANPPPIYVRRARTA